MGSDSTQSWKFFPFAISEGSWDQEAGFFIPVRMP